jgi:hypothetical protein
MTTDNKQTPIPPVFAAGRLPGDYENESLDALRGDVEAWVDVKAKIATAVEYMNTRANGSDLSGTAQKRMKAWAEDVDRIYDALVEEIDEVRDAAQNIHKKEI